MEARVVSLWPVRSAAAAMAHWDPGYHSTSNSRFVPRFLDSRLV